MAIVDKIDWTKLDKEVEIQQRNREVYAPVVSLYRWWARRPHAVAGAILEAAKLEFGEDSFVVADPFSGGGTVAFEAARRNLPIYAQDLYPWPSLGLVTSLTQVNREQFKEAKDKLIECLEPLRQKFWRKENGEIWEITHIIRVRVISCPECKNDIYLFRDPLISLASRRENESDAFFGCESCGTVSRQKIGLKVFKCKCGYRRPNGIKSRLSKSNVRCIHCNGQYELNELLSKELRWKPVLLQEKQISNKSMSVILRQVRDEDPIQDYSWSLNNDRLKIPITNGIETEHLLKYGYRYWGDLYTKRQIEVIDVALAEVDKLDTSKSVKKRLKLSILGVCEMAANLCRWERYHPKALEAIANHRFSRTTLAVETNLLSPIGRGTLPRRLQTAEKALNWIKQESLPKNPQYAQASEEKRNLTSGVFVVTGSSERQLLKDKVVKLVLTDPPYHDDVQYGELSRLFHAWLHDVEGIPLPNEVNEAVPNRKRGTDNMFFERTVASCLAESKRTLTANGRLILTFHNKDIKAWIALSRALYSSGFVIVGLATVNSENASDHSKRGTTAFLSDLIIECMIRTEEGEIEIPVVNGNLDNVERLNLSAIGLALAEKINSNLKEELSALYYKYLEQNNAIALIK